MATFIVPSVGSKGIFNFKDPYNTEDYRNVELEVTGIRSLGDLTLSNLDPYQTIYAPNQISKEQFLQDLKDNVPIITFQASNGKSAFIPANKVSTYPITNGIKYQERVMAIALGPLPVEMNLDKVKSIIQDDIYAELGIKSNAQEVKSSAVALITKEEHEKFQKLLNGRKKEEKSYKIRYEELLQTYNAMKTQFDALNKCIKVNLNKLKPTENTKP